MCTLRVQSENGTLYYYGETFFFSSENRPPSTRYANALAGGISYKVSEEKRPDNILECPADGETKRYEFSSGNISSRRDRGKKKSPIPFSSCFYFVPPTRSGNFLNQFYRYDDDELSFVLFVARYNVTIKVPPPLPGPDHFAHPM